MTLYIILGIIAGAAIVAVTAKMYKSDGGARKLIGESGIVLSDISLDKNGVIKLNGKEYIAAAEDGEDIPKNCKAVVKKVSDEKLFVERIKF